MGHLKTVSAFIIDLDQDTRTRLKSASSAMPEFGDVEDFTSLTQAHAALALKGAPPDVLFISERFPKGETARFIKVTRQLTNGERSAYVVVLKGNEQDPAAVSDYLLIGGDAILCEPYSAAALLDIINLSSEIKTTGGCRTRESMALRLLATDLMNHLDMVAALKRLHIDATERWKMLCECGAKLVNMKPNSHEIYFEALIRVCSEAEPLRLKSIEEYGGAPKSARVRKSLERALWAHVMARGNQLGAD